MHLTTRARKGVAVMLVVATAMLANVAVAQPASAHHEASSIEFGNRNVDVEFVYQRGRDRTGSCKFRLTNPVEDSLRVYVGTDQYHPVTEFWWATCDIPGKGTLTIVLEQFGYYDSNRNAGTWYKVKLEWHDSRRPYSHTCLGTDVPPVSVYDSVWVGTSHMTGYVPVSFDRTTVGRVGAVVDDDDGCVGNPWDGYVDSGAYARISVEEFWSAHV